MTSDLYLFDRLDIPSSNPVLQEIYVLNSKTSECYLKRKKKKGFCNCDQIKLFR